MREGLAGEQSVTAAIYGAGFNSNSRFYEKSDDVLGMKPSEYRAGGANTAIHFSVGECSLGSILVARSARGVCAIMLGDEPEALLHELEDRFPKARLIGGDEDFERLVAKVVGFVEEPKKGLDLPLDVRGTAFQQRVWRALQQIPVGKTVSYADLAKRIGAPKAVRAVANACGANPIAVAIPCHRVVHKDGTAVGLSLGRRTQARTAQAREGGVNVEAKIGAADADARLAQIDWTRVAGELNGAGAAMVERLLTAKECREIAALYDDDSRFRSRIVMARHGFRTGRVQVLLLSASAVGRELADRALSASRADRQCVERAHGHRDALSREAPRVSRAVPQHGQTRPTPLLLRYEAGDYNCLHQDLYGELAFPLQTAILLSEPGKDFTGGEFVLTEQRPRMQSRAEVVPLRQGDAVVFAVHHRPVKGTRGTYRVNHAPRREPAAFRPPLDAGRHLPRREIAICFFGQTGQNVAMSKAQRFTSWTIIDSGLGKFSTGFNYWETKALVQELVRRGEAVRILSHRNAPPIEAFADAEIVPTFSLSTYDKVSTDPQWSTMENFVIHNRVFHENLARARPCCVPRRTGVVSDGGDNTAARTAALACRAAAGRRDPKPRSICSSPWANGTTTIRPSNSTARFGRDFRRT